MTGPINNHLQVQASEFHWLFTSLNGPGLEAILLNWLHEQEVFEYQDAVYICTFPLSSGESIFDFCVIVCRVVLEI